MALKPLRILHISDLHERAAFDGMPRSRQAKLDLDARQRGQVLGDRMREALLRISERGIDLVCLTGDVADWGHPAEYARATERIETILRLLRVPRGHFFAVPGNHDVRRDVRNEAWRGLRRWIARNHNWSALGRWFHAVGDPPDGIKAIWREQILERTVEFWNWLNAFTSEEFRPAFPKPLGFRRSFPSGTFPHVHSAVHIVGLDSAWLCGADAKQGGMILKDQGGILLTDEQIEAQIRDGEHALNGFRIALIHHPLDHLADGHSARRLLGDNGVDLLLHGHQHMPLSIESVEPGSRLRIIAAGCLMEGDLGKDWPNGFHEIEVDLVAHTGATRFWMWSKEARGWTPGTSIYRDAPDGVLRWTLGSASAGIEGPFPSLPIGMQDVSGFDAPAIHHEQRALGRFKVFILFGRVYDDDPFVTQKAIEIARAVGRALARTDYTLLFSGRRAEPAYQVVTTFLGLVGDPSRVLTYVPELSEKIYIEQERPIEVVGTRISLPLVSGTRRRRLVNDSNVIISLAGRQGTEATLYEAGAAKRALVPIAVCGGPAKERYLRMMPAILDFADDSLTANFATIADPQASAGAIADAALQIVALVRSTPSWAERLSTPQ